MPDVEWCQDFGFSDLVTSVCVQHGTGTNQKLWWQIIAYIWTLLRIATYNRMNLDRDGKKGIIVGKRDFLVYHSAPKSSWSVERQRYCGVVPEPWGARLVSEIQRDTTSCQLLSVVLDSSLNNPGTVDYLVQLSLQSIRGKHHIRFYTTFSIHEILCHWCDGCCHILWDTFARDQANSSSIFSCPKDS